MYIKCVVARGGGGGGGGEKAGGERQVQGIKNSLVKFCFRFSLYTLCILQYYNPDLKRFFVI